jgi:hypothetical protein
LGSDDPGEPADEAAKMRLLGRMFDACSWIVQGAGQVNVGVNEPEALVVGVLDDGLEEGVVVPHGPLRLQHGACGPGERRPGFLAQAAGLRPC